MKRAAFLAVFLSLALAPAALAQTAPHEINGVMDGILHFVPFDSSDLSDLYAVHTVGVTTGRLRSLGFCRMFTVQKPTSAGLVIDGHVWIVTPSGDRIEGEYEGTTRPGPVPGQLLGEAEFVITGGTGRFENASGTIHATAHVTFLGFTVWTWPVVWELEGTIEY